MKAEDVQIGSKVQFSEYGSGTHNGIVLSVSGEGGAGKIEIGEIDPPLRSRKTTIREMAALVKAVNECPAPNPNAGKGHQSAIRNYVDRVGG